LNRASIEHIKALALRGVVALRDHYGTAPSILLVAEIDAAI
jgi:hypothetical protein